MKKVISVFFALGLTTVSYAETRGSIPASLVGAMDSLRFVRGSMEQSSFRMRAPSFSRSAMAMGAPSVGSSGFIRPENRWRVQTLVLAGGLVAGTVIGHLPYAIIPDDRARLVARKYTAAAALAGALGGFLVNGSSRDDTGAVTLGAPTRMVLSTAAGALFGIGGALLMGGFRDGDRATMAVFYAVSGAVAAFFSSGSVEISRKI